MAVANRVTCISLCMSSLTRSSSDTAMLGGTVEVPTLGRPVRPKIPAGTQAGRKFRLSGKGMPVLKKKGQYGDLYARVLITVPEHLTAEQRRVVEQLKATF